MNLFIGEFSVCHAFGALIPYPDNYIQVTLQDGTDQIC